MKRFLIVCMGLLAAQASFAADMTVEEPVVEATAIGEWTGLYAGVQLGGAFGKTGVFEIDRNRDGDFDGNGSTSPDYIAAFDPTQPVCAGDGCGFEGDFDGGITGGAHVGYDWQSNSIVYGVLADFNITDIGDRQSGFSGTPAFYHVDRDLDWVATVRGRLGYAFNDRFMAYATGGLAVGDVDYAFVSNTPATSVVTGGDGLDVGYTVGGGVVAKLTPKISLGAEYLYTNLGDDDFNVNLSGPAAFSALAGSSDARGSDGDFDYHTIQMKLSYHF